MRTLKKVSLAGLATLAGNAGVTVFAEDYARSYQAWDAAMVVKTTLLCAGLAVVALFGYTIYRGVQNKVFTSKKSKIFTTLLALLGVIIIGANYAVNMFVNVIDTYFAPSYADQAKIVEAETVSKDLVTEIQEEGTVLLENKNKTLPFKKSSKVNIFGISSVAVTYGGSGSGAADESKNINLQQSLENAGFEVNAELTEFYKGHLPKKEGGNIFSLNGGDYNIYEPTQDKYSDTLLKNAKKFSDTALVVISRNGGEGADLPQNMANYQQGDKDKHYLELQNVEKAMLKTVTANFDKVVVLVNSSNAMELGFLKDTGVDAALWIGGPGSTGLNGVAKILAGDVNPSGRLVDTYAYDMTTNPTYWNTGDFSYTNTTYEKTPWGAKEPQTFNYKFVNYQEGIYLGYRYYETRFVDNTTGKIDEEAYHKTVQYPFGYGLSYTRFTQNITSMKENGNQIEVNVKVTNTGDVAGKEVAQVYYTAPYVAGGIEKSHVVLAGFGKTDKLEPGASQELKISFNRDDLASYDYKTEKAYVLDAGNYEIKLMNNAHDVLDSKTYTVSQKEVRKQRSTDKAEVTNAFEYAVGDVNYLSRHDWSGTEQTERTKDKEASEQIAKEIDNTNFRFDGKSETSSEKVETENNGLRLVDLIKADYDDERWEKLVAQMSVDEMASLIGFGGYATRAIKSVDKPAVADLDGPAGINGIFQGIKGIQYNSEVVVASTWNTDLAKKMGDAFAKEALAHGIVGLYAPAVNIHRSPFSGRNFEYYSEDPLISGKMASSLVAKALENGVYTFTKHFALNDQEDNREGVATWSNEQAIREIYLKAFEIPVKEGGATAIMSSFNRIGTLWAGGNKDLLSTVLRDEWGFRGMVITDYDGHGYMNPDQAIRNGGDLMLSTLGDAPTVASTGTKEGVAALRRASKNILYTVAHSAAFDIYKPKVKLWLISLVAGNVILVSLTALGMYKLTNKKKEEKEVA
ncbi:glycoside hydrolase family 3 protein [Streptococcus ruminantium]|uniref:Glycoside hydrolase family 3 C-terminal domain-containing protein n=1 Tax=Streptococcus ruminantium TaxID=1917441 RepID=A0ABU1B3F9_9STRE|nr:glycoside hydrolase family 3 protein [Streptococcus ruminantium]MDQ8759026.1 glycoside hydrolase family 3 C-terminal domain-containing protein [Streptococcus ruminantium]MDQ8765480.1 glycoside hydrolase family 3 C-terminal domain-containing protein [Streptococcus ruminantium]MDQ8768403.1 glycoside hydrolase family 3 C-terminal domain-containing protein [Streptococcus ruminantium]MDQ8775167.1 glycoside hydrolase family 3 C-terminal domain-containing protein [Streptococcus ruminantium]MDQ8793